MSAEHSGAHGWVGGCQAAGISTHPPLQDLQVHQDHPALLTPC